MKKYGPLFIFASAHSASVKFYYMDEYDHSGQMSSIGTEQFIAKSRFFHDLASYMVNSLVKDQIFMERVDCFFIFFDTYNSMYFVISKKII